MTPQLTPAQLTTLAAAINAEPAVAAFLAVGDDGSIAAFYNDAHATTRAWRGDMSSSDLFNAMNLTQFDGISAGKRDAWRMMVDLAPIDMRRAKMRGAVTDVWSNATTRDAILTDCTRSATKAEALFGGTDRLEGAITAKVLVVEGVLTSDEVAKALRG